MRGPAAARSSDGGRAVFFNEKNNMAELKDNYVMHGMSGKLGNLLVFKQWFGRTIAAKKPRKNNTVSADQQAVRDKFQQATVYAKAAIADAPTLEAYKNKTT